MFPEHAFIHQLQIRRDLRPEIHIGQNVLLQIDARRDLDQRQFSVDQFEDAAFCYIQNILILRGLFRREGYLLIR